MDEHYGPSSEKLVILVVNDSLARNMGSNELVHASIPVPLGHTVADVTQAVRALYPDDENEGAEQPAHPQKGQENADWFTPARPIFRKKSLVSRLSSREAESPSSGRPLSREAESPSSILMTPPVRLLGRHRLLST
jgi:hypothetical protein